MDAVTIDQIIDEYDERLDPTAGPLDPTSPCVCGDLYEEHDAAGRCTAITAVHETTVRCTCAEFELDDELSNGDSRA